MKTIILLSLFITYFYFVNAQTMFVKETSETQTEYLLNDVKILKFSSGNITISKTDGDSDIYSLSGLRYLNFTDINTGIVPVASNTEVIKLQVYPNPVTDLLNINIQFPKSENQTGVIEILSIEGKIFYTQMINSQSSIYHVNVTSFPKGLYLCKINNGTTIETIKFLKP
jgi:hypothetical protein